MVNSFSYAVRFHAFFFISVLCYSVNAAEVFIIGDNGARGDGTNHLVQSVSGDGSVCNSFTGDKWRSADVDS